MRYMDKAKKMTQTKQKSHGAIAVEFALLIIPLLMIVTGIIEFGRVFWYDDALVKGTRDGARFLSNSRASLTVALDTTLQDQAKAMVVNAANLAQVPNFLVSDVTVACDPDCTTPDYITVNVVYPVTIGGWIPVLVPAGAKTWDVTLSPDTTMRYMR